MVGMYEAHKGLEMKGVKLLYDADFITGELADKYNITITKASKSIEQRTDTAPFGSRNIPAVAPNTGAESPYHKPEDTAEALDYEGMALITNYMSDVTQELSSRTKLSAMTGLEEGETAKPEVFTAGLRWNVGSSHFNYRDSPYLAKSVFATQVGLFTSFRMSQLFYLLPELLYETKGSQFDGGNIRTHALTTQLSLALSTPDDNYVRGWIQGGGFYSYLFAGKQGDQPMDFDMEYHRNEYGICFGIGMEAMKMMQMGVFYQYGLSGLFRDAHPSGWDPVQQNFYFMLGWVF
jgi:aminopeptidase YwaD